MLRKAKQKVGHAYSKHSLFKKEFNRLVIEETRKFNLENNTFLVRLYKHRRMWAKPYFMDIFCAG